MHPRDFVSALVSGKHVRSSLAKSSIQDAKPEYHPVRFRFRLTIHHFLQARTGPTACAQMNSTGPKATVDVHRKHIGWRLAEACFGKTPQLGDVVRLNVATLKEAQDQVQAVR